LKNFKEKLSFNYNKNKSILCIGLDPDLNLMPVSNITIFNKEIIDATKDFACAYKPNLSFYEALGSNGIKSLEETLEYIRKNAPGKLIIGDGKRGDIGSTNKKYAEAFFKTWGFDAITVNPFAGQESFEPFIEYKDKGIFLWCKSSNAKSEEFQNKKIIHNDKTMKFYEWIAKRANKWNKHNNIALIVGATYPKELKEIRDISPKLPMLIPGIGAQKGSIEKVITASINPSENEPNIMISASRSILYASNNKSDYPEKAQKVAKSLNDQINFYIKQLKDKAL